MSPNEILVWSGLAIGAAFGAVGQTTGFCLNRAVKDYVESRNLLKARSFALAMLVAIIGTQLLATAELIDASTAIYRTPNVSWLLLPVGATMFGYGMMLANGCGARTVVLLAQGNLRSLVVLLCLGISAYATLSGVLGPARTMLAQATNIPLGGLYDLSLASNQIVLGLLLVVLVSFVFYRGMIFRQAKDLLGGLAVGLLVVAGWFATGWLAADEFEPTPLVSLTFIAPIGETIQYAMIATGMRLGFPVALILGVLLGSFGAAAIRGTLQLQGFSTPREMRRYVLGGVLMGVGGALGLGCSIGQGLTGMSTLAFGSMIASICILFGAALAAQRSR
ncbi:MAG: YeeE/YedE family protein [Betaproteobacteria bacterium]